MNFADGISGNHLLILLLSGLILLIVFVQALRYYLNWRSEQYLSGRFPSRSSNYRTPKKYPQVDVFRFRSRLLSMGLIGILIVTIAAFNWTSRPITIDNSLFTMDLDVDIEMEPPPPTTDAPPPPPPPPPTVIEAVPQELVLEEEIEFIDQSIDAESSIDVPLIIEEADNNKDVPPPPPPPPPPAPDVQEIFKVVEEMPRFPGCESLTTIEEKTTCAQQKMYEFLYRHLQYPAVARENNIEGMVVIGFVVDTDGKISEARILRDVGGGCGAEALRVVKMMNEMPERWIPGRQRKIPVRVMYSLPVRFKLQNT